LDDLASNIWWALPAVLGVGVRLGSAEQAAAKLVRALRHGHAPGHKAWGMLLATSHDAIQRKKRTSKMHMRVDDLSVNDC